MAIAQEDCNQLFTVFVTPFMITWLAVPPKFSKQTCCVIDCHRRHLNEAFVHGGAVFAASA